MANELLRNSDGEIAPQQLTDGATLTASDLTGDDSQWEILDDLATETTLSSIAHAEDTAHSDGDSGVGVLGVRNDTLASLVDADGDWAPLQVDQDGALYVTPKGTLGAVEGDTAHDSIDGGDPVKVGGKAHTGTPTAVADGDRVNAQFDEFGRQIMMDVNAILPSENGIEIYGNDGSQVVALAVDSAGHLQEEPSSEFSQTGITNSLVEVSASALRVSGYHITNLQASDPAYIKVWDDVASNITLGTTTPDYTWGVPGGSGATRDVDNLSFSNGLTIAATLNPGGSDSTAPTSPLVVNIDHR